AFKLRPAVPRPGAKAEGRIGLRTFAGDQHRAKDNYKKPAFNRWHYHGDLRLPPGALRPTGPGLLPRLSNSDRDSIDRRDYRASALFTRRHQGLFDGPLGAKGAREI